MYVHNDRKHNELKKFIQLTKNNSKCFCVNNVSFWNNLYVLFIKEIYKMNEKIQNDTHNVIKNNVNWNKYSTVLTIIFTTKLYLVMCGCRYYRNTVQKVLRIKRKYLILCKLNILDLSELIWSGHLL